MPQHHATPELLLDYASGAMAPAPALAIASHLALDPQAAADYGAWTRLGGALLERLDAEEAGVDDAEMARMLARLDDEPQAAAPAAGKEAAAEVDGLPYPLRRLLGAPLDRLAWRRVAPGVREYKLPIDGCRHKAVLLSIAPGRAVPRHRHGGQELTLVLAGGYRDGALAFDRGDLQIADQEIDHRPVADPVEGCVCLVVLDAPIRFTGPLARWLNGLVRY
ncbi:MAG: ChrR family anti-sigma-E factor [Sphingomonadales bacterium]